MDDNDYFSRTKKSRLSENGYEYYYLQIKKLDYGRKNQDFAMRGR